MAEFHVVAHGLPPDSWRIERVQHRGAVNALAKFFIGVHSVNFVLVRQWVGENSGESTNMLDSRVLEYTCLGS